MKSAVFVRESVGVFSIEVELVEGAVERELLSTLVVMFRSTDYTGMETGYMLL